MHRILFKILLFNLLIWDSLISQEVTELSPQDLTLQKIWLNHTTEFTDSSYRKGVDALISSFEEAASIRLEPQEKRRVGLKVYSNSGAGISTPLLLVDAVIQSLLDRGYNKDELFIIDLNTDSLWRSTFIRSRSDQDPDYNGVEVYALSDGKYFDPIWYYDSPLPSQYIPQQSSQSLSNLRLTKEDLENDRKSFLPVPLLLEVDFWINLPVVTDHPELGINGTLANATLWNISNPYRFMNNSAGASAAIAEIAAIPELRENMIFSIVSLERLQYMGGPIFNSGYVREYPEIYLSSNPVALDRIFLEKLNRARQSMGFQPVAPLPPVFEYAKSLGLGDYERGSYEVIKVN